MKISLTEYGQCQSEDCIYKKSCASHQTAGDFRSEDGFRPETYVRDREAHCVTYDEAPDLSNQLYTVPHNESSLDKGFVDIRTTQVLSFEETLVELEALIENAPSIELTQIEQFFKFNKEEMELAMCELCHLCKVTIVHHKGKQFFFPSEGTIIQ